MTRDTGSEQSAAQDQLDASLAENAAVAKRTAEITEQFAQDFDAAFNGALKTFDVMQGFPKRYRHPLSLRDSVENTGGDGYVLDALLHVLQSSNGVEVDALRAAIAKAHSDENADLLAQLELGLL